MPPAPSTRFSLYLAVRCRIITALGPRTRVFGVFGLSAPGWEPPSVIEVEGWATMRHTPVLWAAIAAVLASVAAAEYQVNTRTTYDQTDPSIAINPGGDYLIVWSSYRQDGDSGGIFAQRFDPNCRRIGAEFQINTATLGNQTDPDAAMYETGAFIVAWHGPGLAEEDIYARRFDPDAEPTAEEFRINSLTENSQRYPRVALSKTGAFVVVWETEISQGEEITWAAAGRLYDANGAPVGNEFYPSQVAGCRYPDAAMDAYGNFVVVWMQEGGTNSVLARLYEPPGTPITDAFLVSSASFGSQTRPAVAMQNDGRFVVTWDGHPQLASMDNIHARWHNSDGTALSEEFTVNTTAERSQQNPRISMTEQGEFVIVWHSETGSEVNAKDVYARQYNASCMPVGDETRLNSFAPDEQKYPAVAVSRSAKYVAAWQSYGQDGSQYGIFATSSARICPADFSDDGFVNFLDYRALADEWLATGDSLTADLTGDDLINPLDLAEFCRDWLSPCQQCRLAE